MTHADTLVNSADAASEYSKLSLTVITYLDLNKYKAANEDLFYKGKKSFTIKDIAEKYCKDNNCSSKYNDVYQIMANNCKIDFENKNKNIRSIATSYFDKQECDDDNKVRLTQVFFSESLRSKGYILTPENNDFLVSEKPHSIDFFYKDIGGNFDEDTFESWKKHNIVIGEYCYKPWQPTLLKNESRMRMLNTYKKPTWNKHLEGIKEHTKWEELNPILRCFYTHLFPCEQQRNWVLNWMNCSIACTRNNQKKKKLSTYLTLIGAAGIGKGILVEKHLSFLHGMQNYAQDRDKNIAEKFALSAYANKTLVHINEGSLRSEQDYDIVKSWESSHVLIENKGSTAITTETYFNVAWSSNNHSKMRHIREDDRRFAMPDLTKDEMQMRSGVRRTPKTMQDDVTNQRVTFDDATISRLMSDPDILFQLADYILGLDPDFALAESALKYSENYEQVIMLSREEWVQDIFERLNEISFDSPGGTLTKLGTKEVELSTDKDSYYTYQIQPEAVQRIADKICKDRRNMTVSKRVLYEKLSAIPKKYLHVYASRGYVSSIRIRHDKHDEIIFKLREIFKT